MSNEKPETADKLIQVSNSVTDRFKVIDDPSKGVNSMQSLESFSFQGLVEDEMKVNAEDELAYAVEKALAQAHNVDVNQLPLKVKNLSVVKEYMIRKMKSDSEDAKIREKLRQQRRIEMEKRKPIREDPGYWAAR